ncbi:MAG TPA: SGNH/GDSL hydrolase family protein [Pseudolabrys sp.]|nr:SGNH/GDSL hydrolase family protein [Pseudolabrys sp.]
MRTLLAVFLGALACAHSAAADTPADCRTAESQSDTAYALPHATKAIAEKHLNIFVLGAGSSSLPGPNGVAEAYPARLQAALSEKLPGVAVRVTTDIKPRRTAMEMLPVLKSTLATLKPDLVIWQTGTSDAVRNVDPESFKAVLDKGIGLADQAGANTILMNMQYSPRTESMIALGSYAENMRWVALQHELPLFDRFSIMKVWSELGTFDLTSDTKKLDIAQRVHDCIGRLLGDLILEATKPDGGQAGASR